MNKQRTFLSTVTLLLIPLSSCKMTTTRMYAGTPRSSKEVARIEPYDKFSWFPAGGTRTFVHAIDGQKVGGDIAEVLPGHHVLHWGARFIAGNSHSEYWGKLELNAEPGCCYQLMAYKKSDLAILPFTSPKPTPPEVWVEDKATKNVVAGSRTKK